MPVVVSLIATCRVRSDTCIADRGTPEGVRTATAVRARTRAAARHRRRRRPAAGATDCMRTHYTIRYCLLCILPTSSLYLQTVGSNSNCVGYMCRVRRSDPQCPGCELNYIYIHYTFEVTVTTDESFDMTASNLASGWPIWRPLNLIFHFSILSAIIRFYNGGQRNLNECNSEGSPNAVLVAPLLIV
eukprot:COSAG02_NODE_8201_length_2663_cov_27.096307_3_plen_186_part_01